MATKKTRFAAEMAVAQDAMERLEGMEPERQRFVLQTIAQGLRLSGGLKLGAPRSEGDEEEQETGDAELGMPPQFFKRKRPSNDVERVTCAAYYLHHGRGIQDFKTQDLSNLIIEARITPIPNPAMAVQNARNAGLLAPIGRGGRKQLTALGEDVVNAMPGRDAVNAVRAAAKKAARRKRRRKKSGKVRRTKKA